jgi:phenylacetate-CoA ligase
MKGLEYLRRSAYWTYDRLTGGKVSLNLKEIQSHFQDSEPKSLSEYRNQKLHRLLRHATYTTDFYKTYRGAYNLEDFPVIDKNLILDNFDSFRSETYLRTKNFLMTTSGSTGVPFRLYQDRGKKIRNTADTLYFAETTGYRVGHKFFYLRAWDTIVHGKKGVVESFLQNVIKVNVNTLDAPSIEKFISELKCDRHSSINIMAYPSAFESILAYLDGNMPELRLNNVISIIGIGEALDPYMQSRMIKYFQCPVVSRYSNNEMGILAQQPPWESDFRINTASYYLEVLKLEEDAPAAPGETGRIVVTDYFNYCMPMIRYDTGDLGVISKEHGFPFLSSISGRKVDMIYSTSGKPVPPSAFMILANYRGVKQYQFIQKGKRAYICRMNVNKSSADDEILLCQKLKKVLGADAEIVFEYVREIPILASGKRKWVMNEFR